MNNRKLYLEIKKEDDMKLLYVDLFCGAGGTSTGVESARLNGERCAKVIACVNHDKNAIASHAANHPEALHFTEDIRTLELSPLVEHVLKTRVLYPDAFVVLWASLECTNFSKAKGGQPRDADSRTLAEHLFRYIESINPDYIQIENVEEFMSWGPMNEEGKPLSTRKGEDYTRLVSKVKSHGYNFDYRILNAADYGAYTSRKRFFGIFAKNGLPVIFPEPTHCKEGKRDLFDDLARWKPVKDVLDLEDERTSIFTRKKTLSEKTLERIYAGLIKFVAGGKEKWLLKYNSINGKTGKHVPPGIDEPCPTVSCQGRLGFVNPQFLSRYNTVRPEDTCKSINDPCGVLTTHNRFAKVGCRFLNQYFSGHPESKNIPIAGPAHTIKCKDNHSLVNMKFLAAYYGNGDNVSRIDKPCPTVPTKDRFAYISSQFMDMQYGNGKSTSLKNPAGTVTINPKHKLVTVKPWVMNTNLNHVEKLAPTITVNQKYHYLMNPQFASPGSSVDDPCFTLIARMDKRPPHIVSLNTILNTDSLLPDFIKIDAFGNVFIEIYEDDSSTLKKIKEFMAIYGIIDILMRMLKIHELLHIMGFPKGYKLIGSKADQKKFIGNAVEVNMARVLCEFLAKRLHELKLTPAVYNTQIFKCF